MLTCPRNALHIFSVPCDTPNFSFTLPVNGQFFPLLEACEPCTIMLILSSFRCQVFFARSFGVDFHPFYTCSYSSRTFSYKACQLVYHNLKVTKDAIDWLVQVKPALHTYLHHGICTDLGVPCSKHFLYAFTFTQLHYLFPFTL